MSDDLDQIAAACEHHAGEIAKWREDDDQGPVCIELACDAETLLRKAADALRQQRDAAQQEKLEATGDYLALLKEAKRRVQSSPLYRQFMEHTPLENDVAVWMADFAEAKLAEAQQQIEALTQEQENVKALVGQCLSSTNQNFVNDDLVASMRDVVQVYVSAKDNAKEAMVQFDYRGRELEAANHHVKIVQGERDQFVAERDAERARLWDAIIAVDAIEHKNSLENNGDLAERIERVGTELATARAEGRATEGAMLLHADILKKFAEAQQQIEALTAKVKKR